MGDIKLFQIVSGTFQELQGTSVAIEKTLQALIEKNLETLLGVRPLATEYSTGKTHGGRIDTLGIDENGSPVIIEYKRALNENVINQGLFYLDWLMDHKAEFELLVLKKISEEEANSIDWTAPRLLCIASDFTKYDEHAVQQINRNIELIRYRRYGEELLLFELVNTKIAQNSSETGGISDGAKPKVKNGDRTITDQLAHASPDILDRFEAIKAFLLALSDDVQLKTLKYYIAFRRIKNFACVEVYSSSKKIFIYVKVNPDTIQLEKGFTRDMRNIGHFSPGDLEISIQTSDDLEKAKPLILKSFEGN